MRNLIKGLSSILILMSLTGCFFLPSESTIYTSWAYSGSNMHLNLGDTLIVMNYTIDHDIDNYFSTQLLQITEDSLTNYMNTPGDGSYESYSEACTVSEDSIIFETITYQQFIDNDDRLVLTRSTYDTTGALILEIQMFYTEYNGNIPPANWLSPLQDDMYEPDNITYTSIEAGKIQKHTLTENDSDYYSFPAIENHTYLIQVNANTDNRLYLKNAGGTTIEHDDDNDNNIEGLEGNVESVIRWTATSTEEFYLLVIPFIPTCIGYYEIKIIDEGLSLDKSADLGSRDGDNYTDKKSIKINYLEKYTHSFFK